MDELIKKVDDLILEVSGLKDIIVGLNDDLDEAEKEMRGKTLKSFLAGFGAGVVILLVIQLFIPEGVIIEQ